MPIPSPLAVAPYDMLESVLNTARTRVNDAIASLGGDILTDVQPFTGTMTNSAWRKLQAFLANLGYSRYKRKFWGYAYPVTAVTDPSLPNILSWTSFFDGTSYWTPPNVNVLPFDFICPLKMGERQTGSLAPFRPMHAAPDGLYEQQKIPWNRQFEWKNDQIYIPGSTFSMDLEVEYAAYDADFVTTNNVLGNPATNPATTPSNMPVPIMRCQSAFANYLCAEVAVGRDDVDMQAFVTAAETDAKLIMNNDVRLKQRTPVQRRAYSGRGHGRGQLWGTSGY
jgi:hypothetical protein